ncbi:MAG: hypothetical protein ACRDYA_17105 [Egibacteraceae bacterium]
MHLFIGNKESVRVPPIILFLFLLASFVCFIIAALGGRTRLAARVDLIALGLALFVLIPLVQALVAII